MNYCLLRSTDYLLLNIHYILLLLLQHCNTRPATLQHCNTATLQHCNTRPATLHSTRTHCSSAKTTSATVSRGSGQLGTSASKSSQTAAGRHSNTCSLALTRLSRSLYPSGERRLAPRPRPLPMGQSPSSPLHSPPHSHAPSGWGASSAHQARPFGCGVAWLRTVTVRGFNRYMRQARRQ